MMGSTVIVQGPLFVGTGIGATGAVWMTGGQLVATNSPIFIAPWGDGIVTISNGVWIGNSMQLGMYFGVVTNVAATNQVAVPARGTLNLDGGSATLYSNMVIGNCPTGGVGTVNVNGGSLSVTNAAHNAYIDVRDGQLILNGGLLQTDVLILTNACGQFIHNGGTLHAGSVVFDTNTFRITSVTRQGHNLLLTWMMWPERTNALQATRGGIGGAYTTNGFTDIFVVTNTVMPGIVTNYLDVGGATNSPARYFRVRLVP